MVRFRLDIPEPEVIENKEGLRALLEDLWDYRGPVAYDTETSGLEFDAACYLIAIAYRSPKFGGRRILIPTYLPEHFAFFEILKPWFESKDHQKVAHNAPYDWRIMKNHGIDVQGVIGDTLKMHHLYDEEDLHGLKAVSKKFLGIQLLDFKEIFLGKGKKMTRTAVFEAFEDATKREAVIEYATLDSWTTLELFEIMRKKLRAITWETKSNLPPKINPNLWDMHTRLDLPLLGVLQKMERRGIPIDRGYLEGLLVPLKKDLARLNAKVSRDNGVAINLGSGPQVAKLLFDTLKLNPVKKTATGYSVDKAALETLLSEAPEVIRPILEYREINKIRGTYVEGLLKHVSHDGRIHTTLSPTLVTGRLRSSRPNLLNLPRASGDKYGIRAAVSAPPGKVMLCLDYDQLELMILAGLSQDQSMLRAMAEGKDLHSVTAADMYGLDYDEIIEAKKTPKEARTEKQIYLVECRTAAKRTGFGIVYGIGGKGLSIQISQETRNVITPREGKQLIDRFLYARPGVGAWIKGTLAFVNLYGYVKTVLGRFRRPKQIWHAAGGNRARAERQAQNSPIQGSAMDLITCAMIQIENDPELSAMEVEMILQIHDELLFEVPERFADMAKDRIKAIMEEPEGFPEIEGVHFKASGGAGPNWAEAKG